MLQLRHCKMRGKLWPRCGSHALAWLRQVFAVVWSKVHTIQADYVTSAQAACTHAC